MNIDINISKKVTLIEKSINKLKATNLLSDFLNKWQIPVGNVESIHKWKESLQESREKHEEYQKDLIELALKADWPREEFDTFEDNLILPNIHVFHTERVIPIMVINEITKEKELYLRILGNTTKDDLRDTKLWEIITEYKKQLPNYTKRNYPDKNNPLRQRELGMSNTKKPREIETELGKIIESQEEKHPEVENLYDKTTNIQISKDIYKQKKILGITGKK